MSNTQQKPLLDTIILGGLAVAALYLVGSRLDGTRGSGSGKGGGNIDPRRYAVKFSINNTAYRFLGTDPDQPERPFKTQEQAITIAKSFNKTGADVKGKAKVIDVKTGREVAF
jgi:hypothetical protein